MDTLDQLYTAFPATDKSAWIAQLEKDLKGQPWTSLRWGLETDLDIDPFYVSSDRPESRPALRYAEKSPSWEVGEIIEVSDVAAANQGARVAIQGGINALAFQLQYPLATGDLERLLDGVDPTQVSLNFSEYYTDKDPLGLLQHIIRWRTLNGIAREQLYGSIDIDPLLDWAVPPIDLLAEAIRVSRLELPNFKVLQINGRYYFGGQGAASTELGMILAKGAEYLARLQAHGIAAAQVHQCMQYSVAVGTSYFLEIAKLRALRILWNNVLAAYGVTTAPPLEVIVHFAPESQDEQLYTNMIRAATQAMSAILGGADRLYVLPADAATAEIPGTFTRRIARNVQHLLRVESYFDKAPDPAAGSYYIETLTDQLAQKAWERFVALDGAGTFK